VDCLDDATALAYARGELSDTDGIIAHLDTCADCRMLVAAGAGGHGRSGREVESPATIGRFEVDGIAGRGAMGIVYRGRDPRLDRPVALKVMSSGQLDPAAHARLEREARALARVVHPAIVAVYEVGDFDGALFIAMEYVHGGTLEAWLSEPREPDEIVARFVEAGEGLLAAHQAGLVHRDFKPSNAMLDEHGRVRVTDFGLVSDGEPEPDAVSGPVTDVVLTQTGMVLGTPAYMAPEQLAAGAADPRSDQFSFCVALFEALAGHRPFAGRTLPALVAAIESGELQTPRRPIARRVYRALRRGLARKPTDRFASMAELLAAIGVSGGTNVGMVAAGAAVTMVLVAVTATWVSTRTNALPAIVVPPVPSGEAVASSEPAATVQACADTQTRWTAVWNDERKAELRAFEVSWWPDKPGPGVKPKLAERWEGIGRVNASATLDEVRRFGDTWRSLYEATCANADKSATSSSRLRRACLVDVLGRVDALITEPPRRTFREALDEHRAMLSRCSTHMVESLTLPKGETLAAVERGRELLATAEAARFGRDWEQARRRIDSALELAETTGDPPLLAEVWLSRGRILAAMDDVDAALEGFHEAVSFAQPAGHHRVQREGADALAWWYMIGTDDVPQSRRWLQTAQRLDGKVPPSDAELAQRQVVVGYLAQRQGNTAAAIEAFTVALDGPLSPSVAEPTLEGLVSLLTAQGRQSEVLAALQRAQKGSPRSPEVAAAIARHRASGKFDTK